MGGGKKGGSQTIGYMYFMGLHMVLCTGRADRIHTLRVGEKELYSPYDLNMVATLYGKDPKDVTVNEYNGVWNSQLYVYPARQVTRPNSHLTPIEEGKAESNINWSPSDVPLGGGFMDLLIFAAYQNSALGNALAHELWNGAQEISDIIVDTSLLAGAPFLDVGYSMIINKRSLFGGNESGGEGGVGGIFRTFDGSGDQQAIRYLTQNIQSNTPLPAYRGVTSVTFENFYIGNSAYVKPFDFLVTRILYKTDYSPMWYIEKAVINGYDMNPAHILYECLVNTTWGAQVSSNMIDEDSFRAAADTLYAEGFGLSFLVNFESEMESFFADILTHISGVVRQSRSTGLYEIKLLREDFDILTIPTFNEDNAKKIKNYKRPSISDLNNVVIVSYWDRSLLEESTYKTTDLAGVAMQGGEVIKSVELTGVTNRTLAAKIAERMLIEESTPLATLELEVDQTGMLYNIGDPIKLSWETYGISQEIFRVIKVKEPKFGKGNITLTLVEDIFKHHDSIIDIPEDYFTSDPDAIPVPVEEFGLVELPYSAVLGLYSEDDLNSDNFIDSAFVASYALKPQPSAYGYTTYNANTNSFSLESNFSHVLVVEEDIQPYDTTGKLFIDQTKISGFLPSDFTYEGFAYINGEFMDINYTSATRVVTMVRGGYDTKPIEHKAGDFIILLGSGTGYKVYRQVYIKGDEADYYFITKHPNGDLPDTLAPQSTLVLQGRISRPYPPRNVKVDGVNFLGRTVRDPAGTIFSWIASDKVIENHQIVDWFGDTGSLPATATYKISLRDIDTDTVLDSATGLTANTYQFVIPDATTNLEVTLNISMNGEDSLPYIEVIKLPPVVDNPTIMMFGGETSMELLYEDYSYYNTQTSNFDSTMSLFALDVSTSSPRGLVGRHPLQGDIAWGEILYFTFHGQPFANMRPENMVLIDDQSRKLIGFGISGGFLEVVLFDRAGDILHRLTSTVDVGASTYYGFEFNPYSREIGFYHDDQLAFTLDVSTELNQRLHVPFNSTISEFNLFDGVVIDVGCKVSQINVGANKSIIGYRVKTLEAATTERDDWQGTFSDFDPATVGDVTNSSITTDQIGAMQSSKFNYGNWDNVTNIMTKMDVSASAIPASAATSVTLFVEDVTTVTELGIATNVVGRSLYKPISYVMKPEDFPDFTTVYQLAAASFGVKSS